MNLAIAILLYNKIPIETNQYYKDYNLSVFYMKKHEVKQFLQENYNLYDKILISIGNESIYGKEYSINLNINKNGHFTLGLGIEKLISRLIKNSETYKFIDLDGSLQVEIPIDNNGFSVNDLDNNPNKVLITYNSIKELQEEIFYIRNFNFIYSFTHIF